MDHQTTKAAVFKAKEMAATAKVEAGEFATSAAGRALDLAKSTATGAKTLSDRVVATAKKVDENHQEIAAKTDTVSMGLGIAAGVAVAGAKLTAIPLVVAASPGCVDDAQLGQRFVNVGAFHFQLGNFGIGALNHVAQLLGAALALVTVQIQIPLDL